MGERQDYIALDWVAGEIEETLKQATQALDAYIANRSDATKLRFCLTHIHQVHGTLQMVEFFGAALLAQEMEGMAHALAQGKIHDSHVDDALQVLKNAIVQLPKYLEKVKASKHGLPATLLPLLNDLRAVRGESLLSETALFSPDLSSSQQASAGEAMIKGTELVEIVHKLRQMYQVALLGLIRGKDVRQNLNYLAKVCARLAKVSNGCASQVLWRVCIAVLEGMLNGSIEPGVAVKILLRQVDRQIKLIIEQGEAALSNPAPQGLLKNLLYYVARSKANSKFIKDIKAEFNLDESLLGDGELSDETLSKPDSNVMRSVVEALSKELADIRQSLQDAGTDPGALADTLPLFKRITDTMAILGLGQLLKLLQEPYTQLAKLLSSQNPILADDIGSILQQLDKAEAELSPGSIVPADTEQALFNDSEEAQEQLDSAFASVLRESRIGLEQAKEAIIEFVATQWNHSCLSDVPELLKEIRGSLNIVPLPQASRVLQSCESYVNEVLLGSQQVPEWQMLDTLADAITSIDYYLERLIDDPEVDVDAVLDVAAESVAELGYPIDDRTPRSAAAASPMAPVDESVSEAAATDDLVESEPTLAKVIPFQSAAPGSDADVYTEAEPQFDQGSDSSSEFELAAPEQPEEPAEPEFEVPELSMEPEPEAVPEPELEASAEGEELEGEYDPEIVEIFIEEAGEVLETINEYLPQWLADTSNEDARAEVRRAYHTLKGSGRMVGAEDIGELAWSVENMLNRVLDNTFTMDDARFALVQEVTAKVPELVTAFENRVAVDKAAYQPFIARAELLAKEQSPDLSAAPQAPAESEANIPELVAEPVDAQVSDEDDLIDIFRAEAQVHSEALRHYINYCVELAGPAELTDDLQRALHTLKGSANMAGITPVADVVTHIEHLVRELRASQAKADEAVVKSLQQGYEYICRGIEQLQSSPMEPLQGVEDYAESLRQLLEEKLSQVAMFATEEVGIAPDAINQFLGEGLDCISAVADRLKQIREGAAPRTEFAAMEGLLERFIEQSESVNLLPVAELGEALEVLYRRASISGDGELNEAFYQLAGRGNDTLIDMLDQVAGQQTPTYDLQVLTDIQDFEFEPPELGIVAGEEELLLDASDMDSTQQMPVISESDLQEESVELSFDNEQAPTLEFEELSAQQEPDDEAITSVMSDFADAVAEPEQTPEQLVSEDIPVEFSFETAEEEQAQDDIPTLEFDSEEADISPQESEPVMEDFTSAPDNADVTVETIPEPEPQYEPEPQFEQPAMQYSAEPADSDDDVDEEIVAIFIEEADDLLEGIDEAIHGWTDERSNRAHLDDLLRILHTLKGGARLAGLTQMGNLSHNFETELISFDGSGAEVSDDLLAHIQDYQDRLLAQLNAIKAGETLAEIAPLDEPSAEPAATSADTAPVVEEPVAEQEAPTEESFDLELDAEIGGEPTAPKPERRGEVVPLGGKKVREVSPETVSTPAFDMTSKKGPQEVVKVSAQLLEDLVNLAGETSISRGRAEEQISELVFALEEMQITVDRLQEQVRRLDMETEAQILYRQEQVESEGMEGFDPLEMDRYSQLQQLSRSLLESSSDLTDIKNTLSDKSRDMETLLVQQSRINTELQEGLMRSRMVPFSRMVPRLRRIVRQVSGELNKKVDFHLQNVEGELDRTVLERMVAPLEHMLRNAVDHGIERPDVREAAGKSPRGSVTLSLGREGGEIVLTLSDDGGGIDLNAVRKKAIERDLMEPNADLSDHEILQFILQAGFSTASQVTQISGRGVGMDVVHSEIKQLGGTMDIDSELGHGTVFTVRLPFTVSVNRALMVNVGGDSYAIPLNTIEGIVRVSPFELEAYYQPDAPMFEYAGQPYLLRYMGALLHRGEKPILEGQSLPLPVILVRGAEHSVAVQVDSLMGSREIVVKPLGPQFSMVHGLSGATVLGDGSVVVILDLLAMIRADASHLHRDMLLGRDSFEDEDQTILVMVVDDSVTVRKVTSRFLERQGMEVITAKDGVDAVTQLQEIERLPDVMLLDIEMPRMDGFEVASRVKHTSRLKDIPIIMITSRTGEKHRERAMSIGVEEYMGKPYQETKLLETIHSLLGVTA